MIRRLYLDIDGVLNAFGPHGISGAWPHYDAERIELVWEDGDLPMTVTVNVAPEVAAAVLDWHRRGVEIVHLTTWAHNARLLDRRYGLPEFPSLGPVGGTGAFLDFEKLPAIADHLDAEPAERAVWVDDYLVPQVSPLALRWAQREGVSVIAPEGSTGLRRIDLDRIEALLYGA